MEHLLKPIPQKHITRVAQIKKLVKNYQHHGSPKVKMLNNSEYQQMMKIKKAQKLNTQKMEVRELKNIVVQNDDQKDVQMTHIYKEIKDSNIRTLSVKASTPLKRVLTKADRKNTLTDEEPEIPEQIKTKYSDLETFFKQKGNNLVTKQNKIPKSKNDVIEVSKLPAKWWEHKLPPEQEAKLVNNSSTKSSNLPKIKQKTHIEIIVDQIQLMINKNMSIINHNLSKLNSNMEPQAVESIEDLQQIVFSNLITNYKPWSRHSVLKKENDRQFMQLGKNRRKSMSRVYQRQNFKLSVDSFKRQSSFCGKKVFQAILIQDPHQNSDHRNQIINQSKFGQQNRTRAQNNQQHSINQKQILVHRRTRTEVLDVNHKPN